MGMETLGTAKLAPKKRHRDTLHCQKSLYTSAWVRFGNWFHAKITDDFVSFAGKQTVVPIICHENNQLTTIIIFIRTNY